MRFSSIHINKYNFPCYSSLSHIMRRCYLKYHFITRLTESFGNNFRMFMTLVISELSLQLRAYFTLPYYLLRYWDCPEEKNC